MTPEQFDEFKRKFKEQYLDKSNRREPWLYPRKMQWIEASQTAVEMDYNNSQLTLIRQIAAAIGVDPWWVGDRSASTYNNVQEARKALYEDNALPLLDDIRATLNLKVAPLYGGDIYITYDTSGIPALREDEDKKSQIAQRYWQMGIPFEQINAKLNLGYQEFLGWDMGYLPFSVAPVGSNGQAQQPETETEEEPEEGAKSLNPDSEEWKAQEWKRVDTRRTAWWPVLEKRFEPLYQELGEKAANAAPDKGAIEKVIASQSDKWQKTLTAVYLTLIEDFGTQTEQRLKSRSGGTEVKFDPLASRYAREWIKKQAAVRVKTILETQKEAMARLIAQGMSDNLSSSQIAKSIRQFYTDHSRSMAMRVARTETTAAASAGQVSAATEAGFKKAKWLSTRDPRTRDTHAAMDGEEREIGEAFSNGCTAPGIGDDPAETVNCRCTLSFSRR